MRYNNHFIRISFSIQIWSETLVFKAFKFMAVYNLIHNGEKFSGRNLTMKKFNVAKHLHRYYVRWFTCKIIQHGIFNITKNKVDPCTRNTFHTIFFLCDAALVYKRLNVTMKISKLYLWVDAWVLKLIYGKNKWGVRERKYVKKYRDEKNKDFGVISPMEIYANVRNIFSYVWKHRF